MTPLELDRQFKTTAPISQGDVIGLWDWSKRAPLQRYGVIITADCDIANGSPDQELVYLRIISQLDYMDIFWARRKLENSKVKTIFELTQQIARIRETNSKDEAALETFDVEKWLQLAKTSEICEELKISGNDAAKLSHSIDRARKLLDLSETPRGSGCLDGLCEVRGTSREIVLKQAAGEHGKLRDELFFLTGITNFNDKDGYYILLDHIGSVRRDQITDSLSEVKGGAKGAYRFGTLAPTFKYSVAQRFSFLFQRIGLPDEHSTRHNTALDRMSSPPSEG